MDLKEEDILGETVSEHWYYRSKAAALLTYVKNLSPRSILDIGAGSGFFSKELLKRTDAREVFCIDTSYPDDRSELISGKPVRYSTHSGPIDVDLVLMMDVLEHVDDDVGLLREYADKIPSGTYFLITVPAFTFLWSVHDVFLEHKRRYTLQEIEKTVEKAGLKVIRGSYFYGLVFPLAALQRLLFARLKSKGDSPESQLKQYGTGVNMLLTGICAIDRLFFRFNRVAGLTAFCLARKL